MKSQAQQQSFSQAYVEKLAKTGPKPKIYQLGISKVYLKGHPKAGQPTNFKLKIFDSIATCSVTKGGHLTCTDHSKIHTIRLNYDYWKGVEEKVNAGEGILSLREWEGTPYKSKRPEFMLLTRIGVEKLKMEVQTKVLPGGKMYTVDLWINDILCHSLKELALNDGLADEEDLILWLGGKTFHGAIIHFTSFRYGNK